MPDPYPPIIEESHQSSNNAIPTLEDVLAIPDADFNFGPGIFDWPGNDIDFTNFLDQPQEALDLESHPAIASPSDLVRTDTAPDEQIISRHQAISMRNLPRIPALHIRSLVPKERLQRGAQRTTNLILHTLRSYPQMMMRHDLLPPFIHPESISPSSSEKSMEPLVNCISLVQMISSKVRGSRKLFWKNVRLECERICAEHVDLTRWQLLTAMQAVCIYTIIRLDEGETDDNNCDFLLLTTTAVIAKQIMCIETQCTKKEAPCSYGGKPCWQDWIYEESRRRLSIVMRIIGMLVYFEPTNMCTLQSDLILAPLPGRKHLWEAKDEATWDTERERDSNMMDAFALAASGDLVKLNEGQAFCGDALLYYKNSDTSNVRERNLANWDEWCSGMDGFGGLVMLAASLVG
ncbi:hypothetical protein P280DRAFT_408318 [Massarina eburnea CBS 473.64]|uniref:Transcription factor domain-containing protein n=1 Tax=Massarina eburnea CBS 473.64 TaxID=1395130 RepID=A0A6A6RNK3_9PLEO|nr:hypothetical protein P280DRAFT_408318 [Massarina eburnea CBS 473.64]